MADTKLSALNELTTLSATDHLYVSPLVTGTRRDRRMTGANLASGVKLLAGSAGAVGAVGVAVGATTVGLFSGGSTTTEYLGLSANGVEIARLLASGSMTVGATSLGAAPTAATSPFAIQVVNTTTGSDSALYLRRSDGATGIDIWNRSGQGNVYLDHRHNSTATGFNFRSRTAGTAASLMTLALDGSTIYSNLTLNSQNRLVLGAYVDLYIGTNTHPVFQHKTDTTPTRVYLIPKGVVASGLTAGIKLFGTDYEADQTNYDDFGFYNATDACYINLKKNGTGASKSLKITYEDTNVIAEFTRSKNLLIQGALGVGNSASATTLGTVTKKIEVFDGSGASLGFVPVYDAIT